MGMAAKGLSVGLIAPGLPSSILLSLLGIEQYIVHW